MSGSGDSACEEETCTGHVPPAGAGPGAASLQEVLAAATKEDGELKLPHVSNGKVRRVSCDRTCVKVFLLNGLPMQRSSMSHATPHDTDR